MKTDFCIIGGGIAGLSVAYHLAKKTDVILLERESELAYHTTGRSAALFSGIYVEGMSRALTQLSSPFYLDTEGNFSDNPLCSPIGCIFTAMKSERKLLDSLLETDSNLEPIDTEEMLSRVPILKTGENTIQFGLLEKSAFKIDVAAMVEAYRRHTLRNKGDIRRNADVTAMHHSSQGWNIELADGQHIHSRKVINASGAWGDMIAQLAGIKPMNLRPLRRTIIVFDGLINESMSSWPAVGGLAGGYYFMPEAGKLLGSAADEIPSDPCDARPEEYDVALAAHNIESHTTLKIEHVHHSWAGLRTFAPDRQPVVGYDDENGDFFWLVGQGGYGIQTAPALAQLAALLALEEPLGSEYDIPGFSLSDISPGRSF